MLPIACYMLPVAYSHGVHMVLLMIPQLIYISQYDVRDTVVMSLCTTAIAVGTAFWLRRSPLKTSLEIALEAFKSTLPSNPVPTEKGPGRALQLKKILGLNRALRSYIGDRTAYYLDANIIRPLTAAVELSFAEVAGSTQVQYFVSHFWGTAFDHFCTALQKHALSTGEKDWDDVSYWVCFFSNNQYQIKAELGYGNWRQSSFYLALTCGHCKATCMVLDELALPLTRAWCIFEVVHTFLLEVACEEFEDRPHR